MAEMSRTISAPSLAKYQAAYMQHSTRVAKRGRRRTDLQLLETANRCGNAIRKTLDLLLYRLTYGAPGLLLLVFVLLLALRLDGVVSADVSLVVAFVPLFVMEGIVATSLLIGFAMDRVRST
jgi:hypothetical protein